MYRAPTVKSSAGTCPDIGFYTRSRMERNLIRFYRFIGQRFKYEPCEFKFDGIERGNARYYKPDYELLTAKDEHVRYVEVKGYMDDTSKRKLERMAKYYPQVKVEVIRADFFAGICRKRVCMTIPYYECKHTGYLWVATSKTAGGSGESVRAPLVHKTVNR